MAFNFSPKIVTDGLISYFDAGNQVSANSSQTFWKDLIGRNDVTFAGNTVYNSQNNGNFTLDGTGDYLLRNTTTDLPSNNTSTSACTILSWCNPDPGLANRGYYNGVVSWGTRTNASPSNAIDLCVDTPSTTAYVGVAYWYNDYSPTTLPLNNNEWNMIGVIARGGTSTNNTTLICGNTLGLNFDTGTSAQYLRGMNFTNTTLRIGCTDSNGTRAFYGKIAMVMIYNRELSQKEIAQNYNALKGRFGLT
jgi:hypothetical protein